ncbi:hypothetical protein [Natronobacterium texcoconense]|uniref:Uncharacterized protein n=1 Tax=Natronobacterium texcoconense TaxID=1095778 RepID=A0A1H1HX05_NATTX|nr:hypothetical protein [Natronobacterium texcoconense]SDR29626.1 hypothetical protein SAMN04489842_3096 [Natronobacterium texcoconense]
MTDDAPSMGPPDRQTLRLLERRLADEPIVKETAFEPNGNEPRTLSASLDRDRYPPPIERARVDVRWYTTDDFSIHYVETAADEHPTASGKRWECRWDRHPNPHNSRCHFHRPPDGTDSTDLELPSLHPIDVLSTVIAALEDRIDRLWESI